jgi:hypothetical protein
MKQAHSFSRQLQKAPEHGYNSNLAVPSNAVAFKTLSADQHLMPNTPPEPTVFINLNYPFLQ